MTWSECTIVVVRAVSASVGFPRPPSTSGAIHRVDPPVHVGPGRRAGLYQLTDSDVPSLDNRCQPRIVGIKSPMGTCRAQPDRRVVLFFRPLAVNEEGDGGDGGSWGGS
ncbi:hypothetical protein FRC08_017768 [Ceratobasidium sp. 394]|nr:hypothetical protein FRC08_017768 [Ceratobasidium sp. 394]